MEEKLYKIFRILGIISLIFCTLILFVSYIWDFGGGISGNIFLFINLVYISLLVVVAFNQKINDKISFGIWALFIGYVIYLYANGSLGQSMFFAYIIIVLSIAAFGIYKLKKEKEINTNKNTMIVLIMITIIMMTYLLSTSIYFHSILMGISQTKRIEIQREEQSKQDLLEYLEEVETKYNEKFEVISFVPRVTNFNDEIYIDVLIVKSKDSVTINFYREEFEAYDESREEQKKKFYNNYENNL